MESHLPFLSRTIQLARKGGVAVQPNPMVGAVIVHDGKIIGEGYHQVPGGPHAEVNAVNSVKDQSLLPESTMYVSLEPCAHHGKTPPCSDLIIRLGIPRVVIGCGDPNPKVSGKGIQRMRDNGVEVIMADDPEPFIRLNRIFFTNLKESRPFICLKWAESEDGLIAGLDSNRYPERTPITGMEAKRLVHKLRASLQGIMIGSRTAIVDDPSLTTRVYPGPSPTRLIWNTSSQPLPDHLAIFEEPPLTYVLERQEVSKHSIPLQQHSPKAIVETLKKLGISSVLIEGGRNTLQAFLDAGMYDEIYRFINPGLALNKGVPAPVIPKKNWIRENKVVGKDWLAHYLPVIE